MGGDGRRRGGGWPDGLAGLTRRTFAWVRRIVLLALLAAFVVVGAAAPVAAQDEAASSRLVVLTNQELRDQFNRNTPMGRPGTVEDIAAAALYLASPASAWVTGKIFQVDGGTEHPSMSVPVKPL